MLSRIPRHILRPSTSQLNCFHASSKQNMARILCTEPIDASCQKIFTNRGHQIVSTDRSLSHSEVLEQISDFEGLIVRSKMKVSKEVFDKGTNLQLVARAGTGVDNIDLDSAAKHGVLVMNAAGKNATSAAELTQTLITALARNIPQGWSSLQDGIWEREDSRWATGLNGKTIGIIGLGRIGRDVARRCQAFGMTVIGYDVVMSKGTAASLQISPVSLSELFARSDFISLHAPDRADTRNIVNAERLEQCKEGAKIINCARPGLIDYPALLSAVESNKISGVAVDVAPDASSSEATKEAWNQLVQHPNVICTPHIGSLTKEAQSSIASDIAHRMADALEGKAFKGVLNAPNVDFVRKTLRSPYVSLAEKIGSVHAQLLRSDRLARILIKSEGVSTVSLQSAKWIVPSVLQGLLSHVLEEEVTLQNARQIAEAMGIDFEEHRHKKVVDSAYSSQISVIVETESGVTRSISGTVFGNDQLRLTQLNDLRIDATPSGHLLFLTNEDRPGVLQPIAERIAAENVNIAAFGLGRQEFGGTALSILTLDDALDRDVVHELEAFDSVSSAFQVNLLEMPFVNGFEKFNFRDGSKGKELAVNTTANLKPKLRPSSPNFCSGPCKKRPGYSVADLPTDCLGRSHRSKLGKGKLQQAIEDSKRILGIPDDYLVGIVPASDTGAFEMAMWNMLGERPVDICYWESFGKGWFNDVMTELKLQDTVGVNEFTAEYGQLPDLSQTNPDHDICFTWNGTTSGVRVPNADWISDERKGLTFNDATSAAFAMDIDWKKVDVTTWSWQKVLGGEGAHGMLVLSPRAVERLKTYDSKRPLPKIFRLKKSDGSLMKGIFEGSTINTPSMLCVEDYLDALRWVDDEGGLPALVDRSQRNLAVLERFVKDNHWIHFLAQDKTIRSSTSVCLLLDLPKEQVKAMTTLLEEEVAYDIGSYRDAPTGLRIWCGATVDEKDLEILCLWLKWAYQQVKMEAEGTNQQ